MSDQLVSERVLKLLDQAFDGLASQSTSLTEVIGMAIRIARLRGDFDNLQWLELEQRPVGDEQARDGLFAEFSGHYTYEELRKKTSEVTEAYIVERTVEVLQPGGTEAERTLGMPVAEIEATLESVDEFVRGADIPDGMHTLDLHAAYEEKKVTAEVAARSKQSYGRVLARIEARVRRFLSTTENQVLYGQINADIFERNRLYVDRQLAELSPKALEQLSSAYQRGQEGGDEARSQALLSCRRAMKSMADVLFPASSEPATDAAGGEHRLTDDKWVNRLCEFVKQELPTSASRDLLQTQIDDLARRFRGLGEVSSRGVHADVTEFELNQAVIQTYLTIGDLLRLRADESGLAAVAQGLVPPLEVPAPTREASGGV